jgi:hypothetical protein
MCNPSSRAAAKSILMPSITENYIFVLCHQVIDLQTINQFFYMKI